METYDDLPDGDHVSRRDPPATRSTSEVPSQTGASASTTNTRKIRWAIPRAPGGTKFRRVAAWLGLSLPLWLGTMATLSPVSVRCTSVSVPEAYNRGFAQVAVVCWAVFRAPAPSGTEPSGGSDFKSVPPSSEQWPTGSVTPLHASWVWADTVGVGR